MQQGYYKTAWNDIKNSPGWIKKMFQLALVAIIPVFGSMTINGYLYGWARDAAWGVHKPMPAKLFGNEDGKLYSRGFYIFVLVLVVGVILGILYAISSMFSAMGVSSAVSSYSSSRSSSSSGAFAGFTIIAGLISFIAFLFALASSFFVWVGSMRISIYNRLSAGFQLKKSWKMMRHDFTGILKIFGMVLLVGLILGVIFFILFSIVMGIFTAIGVATFGSQIDYLIDGRYSRVNWGAIAGLIVVFMIVWLIVCYLAAVLGMWLNTLTARALGYWTRQFDVPAWKGQDDPMPFELRPAAQPGQAQYYQAPPQAPGQAPGQAPAQQSPYAAPQQQTPGQAAAQPTAPTAYAPPASDAAQQVPATPAATQPVVEQAPPVTPAGQVPAAPAGAPEAPAPAAEPPAAQEGAEGSEKPL